MVEVRADFTALDVIDRAHAHDVAPDGDAAVLVTDVGVGHGEVRLRGERIDAALRVQRGRGVDDEHVEVRHRGDGGCQRGGGGVQRPVDQRGVPGAGTERPGPGVERPDTLAIEHVAFGGRNLDGADRSGTVLDEQDRPAGGIFRPGRGPPGCRARWRIRSSPVRGGLQRPAAGSSAGHRRVWRCPPRPRAGVRRPAANRTNSRTGQPHPRQASGAVGRRQSARRAPGPARRELANRESGQSCAGNIIHHTLTIFRPQNPRGQIFSAARGWGRQ